MTRDQLTRQAVEIAADMLDAVAERAKAKPNTENHLLAMAQVAAITRASLLLSIDVESVAEAIDTLTEAKTGWRKGTER